MIQSGFPEFDFRPCSIFSVRDPLVFIVGPEILCSKFNIGGDSEDEFSESFFLKQLFWISLAF